MVPWVLESARFYVCFHSLADIQIYFTCNSCACIWLLQIPYSMIILSERILMFWILIGWIVLLFKWLAWTLLNSILLLVVMANLAACGPWAICWDCAMVICLLQTFGLSPIIIWPNRPSITLKNTLKNTLKQRIMRKKEKYLLVWGLMIMIAYGVGEIDEYESSWWKMCA